MNHTKKMLVIAMVGCAWVVVSRSVPLDVKESSGRKSSEEMAAMPSAQNERLFSLGLIRTRNRSLEGIPLATIQDSIRSPYAKDGPLIDVRGLQRGDEVACPTTGRILAVPSMPERLDVRRFEESVDIQVKFVEISNGGPALPLNPQVFREDVDLTLADEQATEFVKTGFINYGSSLDDEVVIRVATFDLEEALNDSEFHSVVESVSRKTQSSWRECD